MFKLRHLTAILILLTSFSALAENVVDSDLEKSASDILAEQRKLNDFVTQNLYAEIRDNKAASQATKETIEKSLTGNSGIGAGFNTPEEQSFRNWSPTSQDLENMVKQGLQTGSMADQIKYYNEKFSVTRAIDLTPNDESSALGNFGEFSAVSTNAALSVADKSFDNARVISQQLNYLYGLIDQQPTLKQSMDLNTAIALKIAGLQAELMRIQSQQLKIQAVSQHENNLNRVEMINFVEDMK